MRLPDLGSCRGVSHGDYRGQVPLYTFKKNRSVFRESEGTPTFRPLNPNPMFFNQVVGNGANLFVIIVAVVVGFVAALAFIDSQRTTRDQNENNKDMPR